jgi:hypothetical protein
MIQHGLKYSILTLAAIGALALAATVRAEQNGAGHYISGQQSDFSTMVPMTPGLYVGNIYMNYNDATLDPAKELPFGRINALGVTVNMQGEVPAGIYTYPFDFLGGRLASGILVPYTWVDVKASATVDNNGVPLSGAREDKTSGLGDIELMPIMMGWTNGDFQFNANFNVWAPSGGYSTTSLANTGLGYWTFEPMVAVSWISRKIGTEVTVYSAVDFNTKNTEADYQSGDIFHVDGTVAQHLPLFGGLAGAGATAFYLKQITGDSGSGVPPVLGGFMAKSYGVGPTLSYVHPIGKSTLVVDASWLPQLHSDNTTKGDLFWVKVVLSF